MANYVGARLPRSNHFDWRPSKWIAAQSGSKIFDCMMQAIRSDIIFPLQNWSHTQIDSLAPTIAIQVKRIAQKLLCGLVSAAISFPVLCLGALLAAFSRLWMLWGPITITNRWQGCSWRLSMMALPIILLFCITPGAMVASLMMGYKCYKGRFV